jgi:flagellar protein FlaG
MDIRPLGSVLQTVSGAPPTPTPTPAPVAAGTAPVPSPAPAVATPAATTSQTGQASTQTTQPEPSLDQVNHAVQKINAALSSQSQGIEFAVDSTSHRIIIKVVDQQTNQVIRQYPSKEALAIADALDQDPTSSSTPAQGMLIKQQA